MNLAHVSKCEPAVLYRAGQYPQQFVRKESKCSCLGFGFFLDEMERNFLRQSYLYCSFSSNIM